MFSKIINKFRRTKAQGGSITKVSDRSTFSFPIVKQIYSSLISSKMVSVQPMQAPSGNIFASNPAYRASSCVGQMPNTSFPTMSTHGSNMHEILIKDILKNWENIESVLYTRNTYNSKKTTYYDEKL